MVQQVHSSEKGPGIILIWQVRCSEKGQFLFSKLRTLAGLEFRERTGPNPASAGSEFR